MTPAWAWPLSVLGTLGWVLAALFGIGHVTRHLRKPPAAGSAAPGARRPNRAPLPGPNPAEADMLDGISRARLTSPPQAVENSRLIADGLRLRFPGVDDATLGLVVLDLAGYVNAALLGSPDARSAMRIISDAFSLSAEELTRLARQGVPR